MITKGARLLWSDRHDRHGVRQSLLEVDGPLVHQAIGKEH